MADSGKSRVGMEGYLRPRRLAGADTRIYFNRVREVLGTYDCIAGSILYAYREEGNGGRRRDSHEVKTMGSCVQDLASPVFVSEII